MWYRFQYRYAPYLFVAPFIISFLIFGFYPIVRSIWLSFHLTAGPETSVFVGLDNYTVLLADTDFHKAVRNTVIFAFFSVFLQLPLSLGLAMLLNSRLILGRAFFRLGFFSPHLLGMVFVAILFAVVFAPRFGLLNVLLSHLGAPIERDWLGTPELVMPALVLTALWLYVGFNMVYFLAALQAVDRDLYDAAKVDGAGPWGQFLHVTLPGIKHVTVFVVVLSTIGSFQLFELPYLMLNNGPGPDQAGLTVVMYLYQNGFVTGDLGYASAIGWVLVLGVMCLAIFQLVLGGTLRRNP
ncbi:MAG: sugar ABC transporter permease [Phycisphaeraceae bacterium]|nr:sugar ABC transporter permease [Phycisphaeraceae bacterium]